VASGAALPRVWKWIAVVVLVCVSGAVSHAREFRTLEIELLRVTIDSDWVPRARPGYLPIRFDITNLGDARVLEIVGTGSRTFRPVPRSGSPGYLPGGQGSTFVSQLVRLRKGDHVKFTMPMPIFGDNENFRFDLREDGRILERFYYIGIQSRSPRTDASVLYVADSAGSFGAIVPKLMRTPAGRMGGTGGSMAFTPGSAGRGGFVMSGSGRVPTMDFMLEPARLPGTWTGFTSVRAVVIGKAEWVVLDGSQRSALVAWVASGGDLILVDGQATDVVPSIASAVADAPERTVSRHFFGHIHTLTSATLSATSMADVLTAIDGSSTDEWSLPSTTTIETRGFRLRVPGIDGVPARVYLSILVLFSVIIGPVSFWILWRRQQRVLLVLTAPIISIVFIVLLTGYAIAGEGFGVYGRAATFTILDEAAKQAVTRSAFSMYAAGMAPSGGIRFGRDVAVVPIGTSGTGTRERLTLDLTEAQRYSSGVLQARAPTNIEQISFRPSRERLTFTRGTDGVSVVNGMDATLTHLLYRDGDTVFRLEAPLAPGAKQRLTTDRFDPELIVPETLAIRSKFLDLIEQQPRGSYLAVIDHSPFWESGVANLRERDSFHMVLGWPEGQR